MSKFKFIIEVAWTFLIIVCMIYDTCMGVSNHDTYYIAWVILDFIILHVSLKDMKKDIDNM
jgi:hypothetical protein